MAQVDELRRHLRRGGVYRRDDLTKWSRSVDRHLDLLMQDGTLQKLAPGLYYYPQHTAFGVTPPEEDVVVRSFLKDNRFLVTSPNAYNALGVGTTQLYNRRTVYNHKRHGVVKLGNRTFEFRIKPHFPQKLTPEFLLVDLVNNLDSLAEDHDEVLARVFSKAEMMDKRRLDRSVREYGNLRTRKLFKPILAVDTP